MQKFITLIPQSSFLRRSFRWASLSLDLLPLHFQMSQIQNPKKRLKSDWIPIETQIKKWLDTTGNLLTFDPLSLKMISTSRILPNCWEMKDRYWIKQFSGERMGLAEGIIHTKMNIRSSLSHPHVVSSLYMYWLYSVKHKRGYFEKCFVFFVHTMKVRWFQCCFVEKLKLFWWVMHYIRDKN